MPRSPLAGSYSSGAGAACSLLPSPPHARHHAPGAVEIGHALPTPECVEAATAGCKRVEACAPVPAVPRGTCFHREAIPQKKRRGRRERKKREKEKKKRKRGEVQREKKEKEKKKRRRKKEGKERERDKRRREEEKKKSLHRSLLFFCLTFNTLYIGSAPAARRDAHWIKKEAIAKTAACLAHEHARIASLPSRHCIADARKQYASASARETDWTQRGRSLGGGKQPKRMLTSVTQGQPRSGTGAARPPWLENPKWGVGGA